MGRPSRELLDLQVAVEALARAQGLDFPEIRYEARGFDLDSDDVWVFCSDGLQEAVNGVGDQFGGDDLEDMIAALAKIDVFG